MYLPTRSEGGGAVCDKGGASFDNTVGQGELEIRGEELLDVRATHIRRLLDLDHTQDLEGM
jgi:hypothetical protein